MYLFLLLYYTAPASPPVGFAYDSMNSTLSWQPPQGYSLFQEQSALWYYILLEDRGSGVESTRRTDLTRFTLEDLEPDTKYCVSIRTVTSGGFGVHSAKTCFNTTVAGEWCNMSFSN